MDWTALLTAFALMLIIEGLLPFINPNGWKQLIVKFIQLEERQLRLFGLTAILAGVLLLNLIR